MRRRLVVGELARLAREGEGQPLGGGRYRQAAQTDSARRETDGQARWCGEQKAACTYLDVACWPGREGREVRERPGGQIDGRLSARVNKTRLERARQVRRSGEVLRC